MATARLTIVSGENEGQSVDLAPGQSATVGRLLAKNALCVPDRFLAPVHFALRCDAQGCSVQDVSRALARHEHCERRCFVDELRSTGCGATRCVLNDLSGQLGIRVNGKHTEHAFVQDGDFITAGTTVFSVEVARERLARLDVPSAPKTVALDPAQQEKVLRMLRGVQTSLFVLLDAARAREVYQLLLTCGEVYYSLYDGPEAERYVDVAPYLVELPPSSRLLDTLVREHWGKSFASFVFAQADFKTVRRHLRRFLLVESEKSKKMYFRFYDPRVLRAFLPTCTPEECAAFFGPIVHFFLEAETSATACVFSRGSTGLRREVIRL